MAKGSLAGLGTRTGAAMGIGSPRPSDWEAPILRLTLLNIDFFSRRLTSASRQSAVPIAGEIGLIPILLLLSGRKGDCDRDMSTSWNDLLAGRVAKHAPLTVQYKWPNAQLYSGEGDLSTTVQSTRLKYPRYSRIISNSRGMWIEWPAREKVDVGQL